MQRSHSGVIDGRVDSDESLDAAVSPNKHCWKMKGGSLQDGWNERAMAAGSSRIFLLKCVMEVCLAITFQLLAEVQRRRARFWPEFDYVLAGTITAVLGKGYSAWVTAPTATLSTQGAASKVGTATAAAIPTNFFTKGEYPLSTRCFAVVRPAPRLFAVGALSAFLGYGLAASLGTLRELLGVAGSMPPPSVPLLGAAIFTGCFLVTISNLSFQIVQGLIEPRIIDPLASFIKRSDDGGNNNGASWRARAAESLRWFLIAFVRASRGIFVSGLAIRGMQLSGLQKSS